MSVYVCPLSYLNKCSAVAEMGDRLATIDMGHKFRAVPLFLGGGSWVPVACKGAWLNGGGDCNAVAFLYIPLGSLLLDARK